MSASCTPENADWVLRSLGTRRSKFRQCHLQMHELRRIEPNLLVSLVAILQNARTPFITCLGCRPKDKALAKAKKPQLTLHAVTDEEGRSLEDADESGSELCTLCASFLEAREGNDQDRSCEVILHYVQRPPDDIQWKSCKEHFDLIFATQKESVAGPDGLPYSVYRCAGGVGFQLLTAACR